MIHFLILFNRQGKTRLQKWYIPQAEKEKKRLTREAMALVLSRKAKMCSFIEWKDLKVCSQLVLLREEVFVESPYCDPPYRLA